MKRLITKSLIVSLGSFSHESRPWPLSEGESIVYKNSTFDFTRERKRMKNIPGLMVVTVLQRLAAFLGPLLGVTVLHQKWVAFFRPIVERVSPIIKHKRTRAFIYCLLTLVAMCTLLTILKCSLF